LRILWFNWRDIKNPAAGGAEVLTHEIMRRLVLKGHKMTLFTAQFPNCVLHESIDGVEVIRDGNRFGVYRKAARFYRKNQDKYDLIIDEINTRPFLTPTFAKTPIIALFHQMAREFWFYETSFPLNYLGYYYLEKKWLSHYRNITTITISESSKKDLESLDFKDIRIIPEGLDIKPLSEVPQKQSQPTLIFAGRLKKAKLPHHAIQAFELIKKEIPDARMWVVGDGYLLNKLKMLNVRDIEFFGHVSNELKYELMSKAHLALVPAVREGWGLVVTEFNAMGTPVVGYNVPGIRDSVKDGITGILTKENSPVHLADAAVSLLRDKDSLRQLSSKALEDSRNFSWDHSAEAFERIIKQKMSNSR
jgi:glycosyltransferase involved in cell wall biosynthesis